MCRNTLYKEKSQAQIDAMRQEILQIFGTLNLTPEQKYYLSTLTQEQMLSLMANMENNTYENNLEYHLNNFHIH